MRKVKIFVLLLTFSTLPAILQATTPKMPTSFKKQLLFLKKMQPVLHQSFKAKAMDKTNKVLTEVYRLNSPDGKNDYSDTALKDLIKWNTNGTPASYMEYDYSYPPITRTTATTFVSGISPIASGTNFQYSFNWIPLVSISQSLIGNSWKTTEIDSIYVNTKNQITKLVSSMYDTIKYTSIVSRQRITSVTNGNGDMIGFKIDTMYNNTYGLQISYKYDTIYNSSHKITGINVTNYDPASSQWMPYQSEKYILNANNEPVTASRFDAGYGISVDSFVNMKWLYFNSKPTASIFDIITQSFSPTLLFTGGSLAKYYDLYSYNFNYDTLMYASSQNTTFNNDSTVNVNISTLFDGTSIDSTRDAYSYYPNKILEADTSQNWTGKNWQVSGVFSNTDSYDSDNYLITQLNKTQSIASGTKFNYKDTYVYELAAGIEQAVSIASDIRMYPNPANNVLIIQINTADPKASTVRVLNMNGQVISETHYTATNEIKCDVSTLKSGMYLLQYSSDKDFAVKTFVKQ